MRRKQTSFCLLVLCGLCFLLCGPARAESPRTIRVTDVTGQQEQLANVLFDYSDDHTNNIPDFLEVCREGTPAASAWIHCSQIKKAAFEAETDKLRISVTLDNGETISGLFPDPKLKLSGDGDLGNITYNIKDLREIEFLEFSQYRSGEGQAALVNRGDAARGWLKNWLAQPPQTKTLTDGKDTASVTGLSLRDCFFTNSKGSYIYTLKLFRGAIAAPSLTIQKGAGRLELSLADPKIASFEITGKQSNGQPEILIVKKDGAKLQVSLLIRKNLWRDTPEFGPPDPDDMLVWNTPYGYAGVALLPLRQIVIK